MPDIRDGIPTPQKKWYEKAGMIILSVFLGFFGVGLLIFIAFFGYYLWISKYGDLSTQTALQKEFRETFTVAPELRSVRAADTIDIPIESIIHEHNPRFGNPNATVTIVAFIDFECPYCRQSYPTFQHIMEKYAPAVQVIFKHFPLESIHPHARQASLAATCAQEQNAFWEYHDTLFTAQNLSETALTGYAQTLGLNMSQFSSCLASRTHASAIDTDFQDGLTVGIRGTPSYIVNQTKVEGSIPKEAWDSLIVDLLQQ